jgi:5'-nucleotidase
MAFIVEPMRLLITNDDGILAPGIQNLTRAVARWIDRAAPGEERSAIVIAPNRNYSGMSSAVGDVFDHPEVSYKRYHIEGAEQIPAYGLEAAPALCTIIGAVGNFGPRPTHVLSGINAGANVGRSVLHSGTVGAILTGGQLGLSGLAVSVNWGDDVHYDAAAEVAVEVLTELRNAPARTLLNLNVPNLPIEQLRGIKRGRISMAGLIKAAGPSAGGADLGDEGVLPLRLGAATPTLGDVSDEQADEDGALLAAGYASLTPLRGVHEDTDMGSDETMRAALEIIDQHLSRRREGPADSIS